MNGYKHTTRRGAGFTLMELLLAITITGLMVFLINQLFAETSRAVSLGLKSGEMTVESEVIGNQIQRDARRMLGPREAEDEEREAGYLVIVNRVLPDIPYEYAGREGDRYGMFWDNFRSDHLGFITRAREGRPLRALTPQDETTLGTSMESQHARVWYGHALRTQPMGWSAGGGHGDPGLDWFGDPADEYGMNRFANRWIFGRQQLLLMEENMAARDDNPVYAEGATLGDLVVGHDDYLGDVRYLYNGITDVANQPLYRVSDENDPRTPLLEMVDHNEYHWRAYSTTFGEVPLWTNPNPSRHDYASWKIAQTHGQFAANVSEIVVEFAGDYQNAEATSESDRWESDGRIDREIIDENGEFVYNIEDGEFGDIIWYSYYFNNPFQGNWEFVDNGYDPATYDPRFSKTYDALALEEHDNFALLGPGDSVPNGDDAHEYSYIVETDDGGVFFVWRHDNYHDNDDGDVSNWPYLIRIRYRMHDSSGRIRHLVVDPEAGAGGVEFPGRRLNPFDGGQTVGDLELPGRWFEHTIRVNRPRE